MDSVCSIASSVLGVLQSVLDSFFSIFSFLGVEAPDFASQILSLLGCTTEA